MAAIGGGLGFLQSRIVSSGEGRQAKAERAAGPSDATSPVKVRYQGPEIVQESVRRKAQSPLSPQHTAPAITEVTKGQLVPTPWAPEAPPMKVVGEVDNVVLMQRAEPIGHQRTLTSFELAKLKPVEIEIDGQKQTRYVSIAAKRATAFERTADGSGVSDKSLIGMPKAEVLHWAETAKLRAGGPGIPNFDWASLDAIAREMNEGGWNPSGEIADAMTPWSAQSVVLLRPGDSVAVVSLSNRGVVLETPGRPWLARTGEGWCLTEKSAGPWEVVTPSGLVLAKNTKGDITVHTWSGTKIR